MKIAVCLFGHLRSYRKCSRFLYKNLLNFYDHDIFIHTWDTLEHNTKTYYDNDGLSSQKKIISQNDIYRVYKNVKGVVIEKQVIKEHRKIYFKKNINSQSLDCYDFDGNKFRYYSMQKANELRREYSEKTKQEYDYVITIRPDVLLRQRIDIEKITSKYANAELDFSIFTFVDKFRNPIEDSRSFGNFDLFFFGRTKVIDLCMDALNNSLSCYIPDGVYKGLAEHAFVNASLSANLKIQNILNTYYDGNPTIEVLRLFNRKFFKNYRNIIRLHMFHHEYVLRIELLSKISFSIFSISITIGKWKVCVRAGRTIHI